MERNVEIDKISDGKRYGANDLVKVGCDDCRGCSACCHGMGDSIVLDPMDVKKAAAASTMHARASVGCFRWVGCMRMEHFLISFR